PVPGALQSLRQCELVGVGNPAPGAEARNQPRVARAQSGAPARPIASGRRATGSGRTPTTAPGGRATASATWPCVPGYNERLREGNRQAMPPPPGDEPGG